MSDTGPNSVPMAWRMPLKHAILPYDSSDLHLVSNIMLHICKKKMGIQKIIIRPYFTLNWVLI